ncbi:MAG: endoglucanase [Firmicutes bacterium]|nr:endoglucanase [Bacillota bacterium]
MKKIGFLAVVFVFCISIPVTSVFGNEVESIYIINGKQTEIPPDFTSQDDLKVIKPVSALYNQYIDYPCGYAINYPNHMRVDVTLSLVRTVIADKDTQIEIYYDNFEGTVHSAESYINYSNRFKYNKEHTIEKDEFIYVNGLRAHLLKWRRNKCANIEVDKNYYVNVKIVKNRNEVYTIFIKSAEPVQDYMTILSSFKLVDKKGVSKVYARYKTTLKNLNEETNNFLKEYFLESSSLKWGIFEWSTINNFDFLKSLEERLDYTFEFIVRYQSFDSSFPETEIINAYNNNKYVELTLQTEHLFRSDDDSIAIYDILNGKYDAFLNQYAAAIKEFGHPVLFRLNNEMNGDWCSYSGYYTSNDTELFKAAWRYIYNLFQKNGVDNVLWVWNPHDISFPGFKWNHYLTYYPGDKYVDIIGLTGYNTGTYFKGEVWRSFAEIYSGLYQEYISIFQQPFMITEFGSSSIGGDKIAWLKDMFAGIGQFDNIKVAIWWNGIDYDQEGNPGRIYRLDETDGMIEVFKNGLKYWKAEPAVLGD